MLRRRYLLHPPSSAVIKKNMCMQRNTARNGKKISWIRIICLHSCLIVEAKARVSGLEDGVQDVLAVGGDVEQMPFEDGKSQSVLGSGTSYLFAILFSQVSWGDGVWGVICWTRDVMNSIHLSIYPWLNPSINVAICYDVGCVSCSSATFLFFTLFHSTPQATNTARAAITVVRINVPSMALAYAIRVCRN